MSTDARLEGLVRRVEMIDSEMANLSAERREVMAEVKAVGYDGATFRKVIARRKFTPAERGVADALLEAYEAALSGHAPAVPLVADAMSIAADLLAAQLEGLADPARAQALVEHVLCLLDIRAEIMVLREQEKARKALAGSEGFTPIRLGEVARWYERVARHGLAKMRHAEEEFRLYRGTVEEAGGPVRAAGAPTADEKLKALFAVLPKPATQKQRQVSDAIALAQASRMHRGGGR